MMTPTEAMRYRRAAAEYLKLPLSDPRVDHVAREASRIADSAAFEFLRSQAAPPRTRRGWFRRS